MFKYLYSIFCFLFLIHPFLFAQNATLKKDFDFFCKVQIEEKTDLFEVLLEFGNEKIKNSNDLQPVHLIYQVVPSFEGGTVFLMDTILLDASNTQQIKDNFYIRFNLQNKWKNNVLIVRLFHTKTFSQTVQTVRIEPSSPLPFRLHKKNALIAIQNALVSDSLIFRASKPHTLFVYRFKNTFEPATPPMQTQVNKKSANLQVDSIFTISSNQFFRLPRAGLYFAQHDTTSQKGWGFLITENGFPKFKRAEDLLNAALYISTPEEAYQASKAKQKKPALDRFWFQIGETEDLARRLIKRYYDRIEYANRTFTSYKEGWKTDQGMIYVVFGKPDFINRGEDWEEWVYDSYSKNFQTRFMFHKQNTIFSNRAFELQKDPQYRTVWYEAVDKWRRGKLD